MSVDHWHALEASMIEPPDPTPQLDLDGCLERMATERVGHALRLAWLDSNDAHGSPLPPDLAHHLVARLAAQDRSGEPSGGFHGDPQDDPFSGEEPSDE